MDNFYQTFDFINKVSEMIAFHIITSITLLRSIENKISPGNSIILGRKILLEQKVVLIFP